MEDIQKIYTQLIEAYNAGISQQDPVAIRNFLNDTSLELLKDAPERYLEVLHLRAGAFSLFGELDEAGGEYEKGFDFCDDDTKWEYLLNWALVYLAEVSINRGEEQKEKALGKAIDLLDRAKNEVTDSADREFQLLTLANVKAFMLLQIGKREDALTTYATCKFLPVPIPQYNDKDALFPLFSHYTKGLAVAIELKNIPLLMNLLTVISIDDRILMGEANLFKLFYATLVNAFDMRPEFSGEFNTLFRMKKKLSGGCPNFTRFLELIGSQQFEALNVFFEDFYTDN